MPPSYPGRAPAEWKPRQTQNAGPASANPARVSKKVGLALREAANGVSFVFVYVEHGVELGDLQQVLDSLRQSLQLQGAAGVRHGREPRNQLADARAVNIGDLAQV